MHALRSGGFQFLVPSVQSTGFLAEDDAASSLFEEERNEENEGPAGHDLDPEDPAPGQVLGDEAGDEGTQAGAEERGACEEHHGRVAVCCHPDVC